MGNKTPLIVIVAILLCFGGLAVLPFVQKYFSSTARGQQNLTPAAISSSDTDLATSLSSGGGSSRSGPVDGGLGDSMLKADVWNSIIQAESGQNCSVVISTDIDVSAGPDSKGVWVEDWIVKACGKVRLLKVKFTPNPNSGIDYEITG